MRVVDVFGLVEVAARAEHHRRQGTDVLVLAPTDADVAYDLARMRLGRVLTELGADHDLPYLRERDRGGPLLGLTYFESTGHSDELAATLYHRVAAEAPAAARALYTALCEVGQNVSEHAEVPGGWVAAQAVRRGGPLSFAVGDAGIGMWRSLAARGATDDAEALEMALDRGLSRFATAGHGNGLVETCRLVTARRGRVHLASGTAARTVSPTRRRTTRPAAPVPGTLVGCSLPARS